MLVFVFFFKQKTAYEMRISDWSSDVCSSDLIVQAKGHLGGFGITVNGYAPALPSGRSVLGFDAPKNNAFSECDLILDLSGGQPLFAAAEKRDGYFRPDPGGGDRTSTRLNSSH